MAGRKLKAAILCAGAVAVPAAVFPAVALAPADLSITKSDSPDPVTENQPLTYTIEVTNGGPDAATNTVVTDNLPSPSDADFVSLVASQGSCTDQGNQAITCNLGTIASGATATITIVVTAKKPGTISNTAAVSTGAGDPYAANDTATAITTVLDANPPGAGQDGLTCKGRPATLVGTEARETLSGTEGADVIVALGGDDTVTGLGGQDRLCGGAGNDTLNGQADNDVVRGGGGNDNVKGGGGNDGVGGGAGRDRVGGGAGSDSLNGGTGRDFCNGGPGRDSERSC